MHLGLKLLLPSVAPLGGAGIHYNSQMLVVAGQSNALVSGISGATGLPSGWADTSRVQMWGGASFATYSPSAATNWGPEVAYAKAWLAANATGTLYMVKSAVANTQLGAIGTYGAANGATQDWAPADTLYTNLKAAVLAAKAGLTTPVNVTVLWMQGETDAMASNLATAYQSNLTALFAQMRTDFGANVIVSGAVNDSRAWLRKDQIITAQIAVESSKNRFVTADDLALQADGFHYVTASANSIGTALFTAINGGSTATRANTLSAISQNCDPLITLSNSDLTATVAAGATGNGTQVIGKRGATSGKKYFAATIGAVAPATGIGIGLATDTFAVAITYLGGNASSLCLYGSNVVALNGAVVANYFTLAAGDVVEFAVDLGTKRAWWRKNGGLWNNDASANPATGVNGLDISAMTGTSFYPALSLQGTGEAWTLSNGLTPPSGFAYFGG